MIQLRQPQSIKPRDFNSEPDRGDLLRVQMTYAWHSPRGHWSNMRCPFSEACRFESYSRDQFAEHIRDAHTRVPRLEAVRAEYAPLES